MNNYIYNKEKIKEAFYRIKHSGSDTPGVDGVRLSDLQQSESDFIDNLYQSLLSGTYRPSDVKEVTITGKSGKPRSIAILTVNDRIIHTYFKLELEKYVEPKLLPNNFGYRPGKSALLAADFVEECVKQGYEWIGEVDIQSFFDNVDHIVLEDQLQQFISDRAMVSTIISLYDHTAKLENGRKKGIVQGSPLSPLLANVFLHGLDVIMSKQSGSTYVRYADDILLLSKEESTIRNQVDLLIKNLELLKLQHNASKTKITHVSDGFDFLGFTFSLSGRTFSEKGGQSLLERLESVRYEVLLPELRKEKYKQIINGWQQYYSFIPWDRVDDPEILELSLEVESDLQKYRTIYEKVQSSIQKQTISPDHAQLLAKISIRLSRVQDALCWISWLSVNGHSLETSLQSWLNHVLPCSDKDREELIQLIHKVHFSEENVEEVQLELTELLVTHQLFKLARLYHDPVAQRYVHPSVKDIKLLEDDPIEEELQLFCDLFSGREQVFLTEHLEEGKNRVFYPIHRDWNLDDIKEHWNGDMTIAQYVVRSNKTVNYAVIDVDISNHYLTKMAINKHEYETLWNRAKNDALQIQKSASNLGLSCYVVDSGYKGCHVWFFFEEPIQLSVAFDFLRKVISYTGSSSEGITWQLCPNQKKLKEGQMGQAIKLPWGKHSITGRQAWFLDEDGNAYSDQPSILTKITKISRQQVIQFVQAPTQHEIQEKQSKREMPFPPSIQFIVNGCPVVRHMTEKAKNTGFLTHSERLMLLNIFAPIGEEARSFLHQVMSYTMNYKEDVTQRYIDRAYDRPISCVRIREHFPSLTAQLNCNCKFPNVFGAYHSPVLHNSKNKHLVLYERKNDSRKNNKADQENNMTEVNQRMTSQFNKIEVDERKQINQLAAQLIEMRKQQRGIMNKIKKIERELTIYFDKNGIEQVEIDLGYLIREWHEDGFSWVIHL